MQGKASDKRVSRQILETRNYTELCRLAEEQDTGEGGLYIVQGQCIDQVI